MKLLLQKTVFLDCLGKWWLHTSFSAVLGQSSNPNQYKLASHLVAKFKESKLERRKTGEKSLFIIL